LKPLDILLALSVAAMWGMGFTFAKAAIEQFPPILLTCFRFTVTALALVWFVQPPWRLAGRICLAAFVAAAVQYSLTFTGLKSLDASVAILVVQLEIPFAAALAALVFKDRLGLRRTAGMVLGFVGVGLIAGEPRLQDDLLPLLLVVGGAASWAAGQVYLKTLAGIGGFTLIAWLAVFASPQLLAASLLFESGHWEAIRTANWVVWSTVVYLGLVMTALGYGIWYHLLARYDVNQVMPFLLLLPVFTVAGSVVLLGETLTLRTVIGGVIVIAGVGTIIIERNPLAARGAVDVRREP